MHIKLIKEDTLSVIRNQRNIALKNQGSLYKKRWAPHKMNKESTRLVDEMYYASVCLFLVLECKITGREF